MIKTSTIYILIQNNKYMEDKLLEFQRLLLSY